MQRRFSKTCRLLSFYERIELPEWIQKLLAKSLEQAPAITIFSAVFVSGFYFQTRYLGEKIDTLANTVTAAFSEQRDVIRRAVEVIGETKEVIRHNSQVVQESATARKELSNTLDRLKDAIIITSRSHGKHSD